MEDDTVMECVKVEDEVKHFTSFTGFEDDFQTAWRDAKVRRI